MISQLSESEVSEYLQYVQTGLPDGDTETAEGWILTMSNGKLVGYIEPVMDNALGSLVYDSIQGILINAYGRVYNFGHGESGMEDAFKAMSWLDENPGSPLPKSI